MSKFEWKELPDWADDEYWKLVKPTAQATIAWELLRRKPEYQADYAHLTSLMSQGKDWRAFTAARTYYPARKPDETEHRWLMRVLRDFDVEPIITPLDVSLAQKWGMRSIYDPLQPYTQGVRFLKPGQDFPRLISRPEDFEELIEAGELEGGGDLPVLVNWCAPLVFDITRPLDAQLKRADRMLRQHRDMLQASGRFKKAGGMNEKPNVWIRHLRVIDALRTVPQPTSEEIALVLGGNAAKAATKEARRKQGDNFIRDARAKLKADHRRILLAMPKKK